MTTEDFTNENNRYKVIYEDPESRSRAFIIMNQAEINAHRDRLANTKYGELVMLKGVGMIKKSSIFGEKRLDNQQSSQKDFSHITRYIGSEKLKTSTRKAGYKLERVNYKGEDPIYTEIGFCPMSSWEKKSFFEKNNWIEKMKENDTNTIKN